MRNLRISIICPAVVGTLVAIAVHAEEIPPVRPEVTFSGNSIEFSLPRSMPEAAGMRVVVVGPADQVLADERVASRFYSWLPPAGTPEGNYRYEVQPIRDSASNRGQAVDGMVPMPRYRFRAGSFSWRDGRLTDRGRPQQSAGGEAVARNDSGDLANFLETEAETIVGDLTIQDGSPDIIFDDTDVINDEFRITTEANGPFVHFGIRHGIATVVDLATDAGSNAHASITVNDTGDVSLSNQALFVDRSPSHVGIGTTVPGQELHILSDEGGDIRLSGSGQGEVWDIGVASSSGDLVINDVNGAGTVVSVGMGSPEGSLAIRSDGVGVGTQTPLADLHLQTSDFSHRTRLQAGAGLRDLVTFGDGGFEIQGAAGNTERVVRIFPGALDNSVVLHGNGIGIGTDAPTAKLHVAGSGRIDGDVALGSSRTLKTGFGSVNPTEMLAKVGDLPLASWRYKSEDEDSRHIGPFAEDFQRLFGLGDGETISVIDAQGVTLAAIQGLKQELAEKDTQIAQQKARISGLAERLAALEARFTQDTGEPQ